MACIRKRRGKYVVDYRDGAGVRRWITCKTRREAENVLSERLRESRQPIRPVVDTNITVAQYAERWLGLIAAGVKPRTVETHRTALRLYLLPAFGVVKVRLLQKGHIKTLLAELLQRGWIKKITKGGVTREVRLPLRRGSVRIIHATLRAMLYAAVDDGVIVANPVERLGRHLKLVPAAATRQEEIKAMTRAQLAAFLAAATAADAQGEDRRLYPFFLLLARAGLRLGEAFALQWPDLDFAGREIRVARAFSDGRIDTPKSGHGRTVDMSRQLEAVLRHLQMERKAETLRRGWREMPGWVFCTTTGTMLNKGNVPRVFVRLLKRAELPPHFSPHCLRHTFASLLLQQSESPVYVQRQLGHASIKLTVDTYGKWLPMGNKAAVDRLDDAAAGASGSKVVAKLTPAAEAAAQRLEKSGEPCGTRTRDSLLKRQVLYHLS